jgi:hypothetical protein
MRRAALVAAGLAALLAFPSVAAAQRAQAWNTKLVGHLQTPRGFNGDVWVHNRTAYVGSWGTDGSCPVLGVRAVGVANPRRPRIVSRFARFRGATSEDVWVGRIETPSFTGAIAAVGIQRCRDGYERGFRGVAFYDVRRPGRPRLLSRLSTGYPTRGVHELSMVQRPDGRVLALLAVPHAWETTLGRKGDVQIVEVTDPRRPRRLATWDFRRDGPQPARTRLRNQRGDGELLAHSVFPFDGGMKAFVSHWDAGEVFLDLTSPARPRYLGRTPYPAGASGNAHSGWFMPGERILIQNDEVGDFYHAGGIRRWGFQRIFDVSDLANPVQIGTVRTRHSRPGPRGRIRRDGIYSVHNNVVVGDVEVVSWYSDGIRLVSLADPRRPREVGYFVPPPRRDPQRFWLAPNGNRRFTHVWGVAVSNGLIFATDITSGLWIVRARAIPAGASGTGR